MVAAFSNATFLSPQKYHPFSYSSSLCPYSNIKLTTANSPKYAVKPLISNPLPQRKQQCRPLLTLCCAITTSVAPSAPDTAFHGHCYVIDDNIDSDQIIPTEYLTLVPSNPDEYEKLGSYALIELPSSYQTHFIEPGELKSKYSIVFNGENFGCGSSREHTPVALGAAKVSAVVAKSYARIFFKNSVTTGEVYPLESEVRICNECRTGDVVTIELGENRLINHTMGNEYRLKPIGDARPVIEDCGIFVYDKKTEMIPSVST